jgi:lipoprotein-releasing system ATP-binding protein
MNTDFILEATGLTKSYRNLIVLENLDIQVKRGEIVAIVGKSGSGKSTLLHLLGTLDTPDKGKISLSNIDITRLNQKEIAAFRNERIGFIFQFHHLLGEFTALENVCIPGYIGGLSRKEAENKAIELLSYLGLADRMEHKPQELSGGEQQRVAVARALINKPAVIFADEPTGNLDDSTSEELFQLILNLRKDYNQTFVLVTHNMDMAARCDRILTLSNRTLIENGKPQPVTQEA